MTLGDSWLWVACQNRWRVPVNTTSGQTIHNIYHACVEQAHLWARSTTILVRNTYLLLGDCSLAANPPTVIRAFTFRFMITNI